MRQALCLLALGASCLGHAASAIDGFGFDDAAMAARYQRLIAEFRCPKCLNESLASSGAPIAADLRRTVRRLLAEGESDDAIRAYLRERYGDFVLYDPPFKPTTWLLWFAPFALAGIVALALGRTARRRPADPPASQAEQERARQLLADRQQRRP